MSAMGSPSDPLDKPSTSRPLNVQQIVKEASSFEFNPLIPLRYWLRTAATLLKEAQIYDHEGNDQQTYLLLFRHAQLVLGNLTTHPDAKSPGNRLALAEAEGEVKKSLAKLEVLKPRINKRYVRFENLMRDRDARRVSSEKLSKGNLDRVQPSHERRPSDPMVISNTRALEAEENKDLAVRLAHSEIKRRTTARKATQQAGIPEEETHRRRSAGVWGDWEEVVKDDMGIDDDALRHQMRNVRLQIDGSKMEKDRNGAGPLPLPAQDSPRHPTYHYPTVPEKSAYELWKPDPLPSSASKEGPLRSILKGAPVPSRPSKEPIAFKRPFDDNDTIAPALPEKPVLPQEEPPSPFTDSSISSPESKSSNFTFKPSAYLENGTPLRTLFLPPTLRQHFLTLAQPNTLANLETCGILCGTLIRNALFVSKLVIPDQESTSDTCETIDENALFDYCDGEDLMVLGWIHTHPTQTCFMSSRDLHTHSGYQVMIPESVAIVCAPRKGEWGVFRLTDPPGMKAVLNCQKTGLFHPHDERNTYTDCLKPGHVFEAKGLEFGVVDLRPGKRF